MKIKAVNKQKIDFFIKFIIYIYDNLSLPMATYYQPIVLEKCEGIIDALRESNFMSENNVKEELVRDYFCHLLTQKFVEGKIHDDFEEMISEDELERCLREIIAESVMDELVEKGWAKCKGEKNGQPVYSLTEQGKEYLRKLRMDDLIT